MGSASNRKRSDRPIIRVPESTKGITEGGKGGGQVASPENVANTCRLSFETLLSENISLKKGLSVILHRETTSVPYDILLFNKKIGSLNQKVSRMIVACEEIGVKYSGAIVKVQGKFYARFTR